MRLFTDEAQHIELLTEANDEGGKDFYIRGVFLQGNIKNRNGRMYPTEVLEQEVNRYMAEQVSQGRAYGELGHPDGPTINLDRVSHMIQELYKDGDNFIGKAKITSTPMGQIVKGLISDGANLGVSSRGVGSMETIKGTPTVKEDFRLATAADIVADPSAPDAFVHGMMEGVEWQLDDGQWKKQSLEFIEQAKKHFKKATLETIDETKTAVWGRFLKTLG